MTFSMPSAPQNRDCAIGTSLETQMTVVSSKPAASSLNLRTLAEHTPVSTLGKMLRIVRVPSGRVTSPKSRPTSENWGAASPIPGSSPTVWTALPPSAVVAMTLF